MTPSNSEKPDDEQGGAQLVPADELIEVLAFGHGLFSGCQALELDLGRLALGLRARCRTRMP